MERERKFVFGPRQQAAADRLGPNAAAVVRSLFEGLTNAQRFQYRKVLMEQVESRDEEAEKLGERTPKSGGEEDPAAITQTVTDMAWEEGTQQGMSIVLSDIVALSYMRPR